MSRPTVRKQVELPGGGSAGRVTATLRLVAAVEGEAFGYTAAGVADVAGVHHATANSAGLITFTNVRPNSGESEDVITTPAGTVYELTVVFHNGRRVPEYLNVPDEDGPVWAQDCLTVAPADIDRWDALTHAEYTARRGAANGVASLDSGTKVPSAQIPDLSATYLPGTQKAVANGVAPLDSGGAVPLTHLGYAQRAFQIDARDYGLSQASSNNSPALNDAIDAAVAQKKVLSLPGGLYQCTDTLHIPTGLIMRGAGLDPSAGTPTRLSFANIAGTTPAFTLNAVSEVALSDFYLTGRSAGNAAEIACYGNCRGIALDRITINSATTGAGVHFGVTGSVIRSSIKGVTVVNAAYGFWIGTSCTSVTVENTYANNCTVAGYNVKGTYLAFLGTAADGNTLYGYIVQDAVGVAFMGCGSETNGRSGWLFTNADAVSLVGCRAHQNNQVGSASYPSFAAVNDDSSNLTFIGCADTSAHASTPSSLGTFSGTLNPVTVVNCSFDDGVSSAINNRLSVSTLHAEAGTTGRAPVRIPHGVAPTSPVDGDVWTTSAGLFARVNGSTITLGPAFTSATFSSFLSAGTTPATVGLIRLPSAGEIRWQDSAVGNGGYITLNASDQMILRVPAAGSVIIAPGGTAAFTVSATTVTIADAKNFSLGTTTGTQFGTATNQKWATHGATPTVQRAGAAQVAVDATAATNTTPYGFATQAQADGLVALVNELRAALVEKGIIKGSA